MDKKRFIVQEIKAKIVFIAVFAVFNLLFGLLGSMRVNFYTSGANFVYLNTNLFYVSFIPFLFAMIYPLTVFSYRYSKPSVDFFYQLPVDKRYVKRVRMIIGLSAIFILFTLNYLLDLSIVASRYVNTPLPTSIYYRKYEYDFLAYLLAYPLLLLAFFVAFGVSSFASSLSHNKKDNCLLASFLFLLLFLSFFSTYLFSVSIGGGNISSFANPLEFSFAPTCVFFDAVRWGEWVLIGQKPYYEADFETVMRFLLYFTSVIIGVFGFLYAYFGKERSGEAASINGGYNALTVSLPHITFFFLGLLVSIDWSSGRAYSSFYLGPITLSLAYLLSYYFLLAYYYKKLRIAKRDLCIYIAVVICFVVFSTLTFFLPL